MEHHQTMIQANKNDIVKVFFFRRRTDKIEIDPKKQQELLDHNARESLWAFQPPVGSSPAQISHLFAQKFLESRKSTREGFEKLTQDQIQFDYIYHQVGDIHSQNELKDLQSNENFIDWLDPEQAQILISWRGL